MCIVCMNPRSSQDELAEATKRHRQDRLKEKAVHLKELVADCRKILAIHESAGTTDPETESFLKKLIDAQHKLSQEM